MRRRRRRRRRGRRRYKIDTIDRSIVEMPTKLIEQEVECVRAAAVSPSRKLEIKVGCEANEEGGG